MKTRTRAASARSSAKARSERASGGSPSEQQIIDCLQGRRSPLGEEDLEGLFGSDLAELRELATASPVGKRRSGNRPKVYLLHGIMGSELGYQRLIWNDVLWLGWNDVLFGRLKRLRLGPGGDPKVEALGFLPGVYLLMRLHLERAGFEVIPHAYDWRQPIEELGKALRDRIEKEPRPVSVVAHSMGGLVTRAAFKEGLRKVSRFIMLATPNHGSLAPVEALRGQYSLARLIAGADLTSTGDELAEDVFSTFPGLYQMILDPRLNTGPDLFDPQNWPGSGPKPSSALLARATKVQQQLARPADVPGCDWFLIAGIDQPTKVSARLQGSEFVYAISQEGDGTVPLSSALLEGVRHTWYAAAGHGFFANNRQVRDATIDILFNGTTDRLPDSRTAPASGTDSVSEQDLRRVAIHRSTHRNAARFSHRDKLDILFGTPEPMARTDAGAGATPGEAGAYLHRLDQVTIGRKKQRRLEIAFYNGSITEVDARAYVLGTFSGVTPTGAAAAIDDLMTGAIADLIGSNMFGSRTGELFLLPLARRELRAEVALFVGMGQYNDFKARPAPASGGKGTEAYIHSHHVPALEIASENGARLLARTHVDSFATVLLGGSILDDAAAIGESMLRGFLRGLDAADGSQGVRRVVLCETDPNRYRLLRNHLVFLATTPLCEGIEFVLSELDPPPAVRRLRNLGVATSTQVPGAPDPAYLLVSTEPDGPPGKPTGRRWKFAILGPTGRAAVREETRSFSGRDLDDLLKSVSKAQSLDAAGVRTLGQAIATRLLPGTIQSDLLALSALPLVILHDAEASRIPWETLQIAGKAGTSPTRPALQGGITRRFLATSTNCSRWAAGPATARQLRVLLVSNPTGDLPGARAEADAIRSALGTDPRFIVDHSLQEDRATRTAILEKLAKGTFDIVHYSGHAFFDPLDRGGCGLLCHDEEILTGRDLESIARLPSLLFLNACQSAGVRSGRKDPRPARITHSPRSVAETMLCSGIANFIGTYWPVGDHNAKEFAFAFYRALLSAAPLGDALIAGRKAIQAEGDAANYILYGNRSAVLRAG